MGALHRIPALSPDGRLVASVGAEDVGVRLWDVTTGVVAADLPEARGHHPYAIAFSRSGRLVAAADGHRAIRVWEVATHALVASFTSPGKPALALDISPDESTLAVGGDERTLRILSLPHGEVLCTLRGHTRRDGWTVAFSPDGALLASSDGNDIRLWHTTTGELAGVARVGAGSLAFSPDGRLLVAGGVGIAWVVDLSAAPDVIRCTG